METITACHGMTATHGFRVTVSLDPRASRYVAQISAYSPPLAARLVPGQKVPMMQHYELGEVTHDDPTGVVELAKKRITSQCGEILRFIEESAEP